ncbi:MAG TPA: hypothetical protein VGI93_04085 [Steroidobacteraceae bacterium]|jgi:hypothetical protein
MSSPIVRISKLILMGTLLAACGKQSASPSRPASQAAPTPSGVAASLPQGEAIRIASGSHEGESADSFFDPKAYPGAVTGAFSDPEKLTASERQYGVAPKRDPRVSYQDDVILMEHGDQAIREAKSDGMSYIFDAKAEHVGELAEGKIVFATGRVVGRIGQITRDGDSVTVKLAPINLTDVIKKGTFLMDSGFSAKDLLFYSAPDFPNTIDNNAGKQASISAGETGEPRFLRANLPGWPGGLGNDPSVIRPPQPPMLPAPELKLSAGLGVHPAVGADGGIGINFSYVKNGVLFNAYGQLVLPSPHVRFLLDIDSSGIKTFGIEITGSIGLRMSVEAMSDVERYVNVNTTTVAPLDITLPCPLAGVPLALNFRTSFTLHTKFAAKRSILTSSGSWSLNGTLFVGKRGGADSHTVPDVKNTSSLAANVSGVSMGINTIGGGVNVRPMIGLGAFGFMTGVYMGVTFTAEVGKQASQAMSDCHVANGSAVLDSGVGYKVPAAFANLINGVLSVFTKYRMEQQGTIIKGWSGTLFDRYENIPEGCSPAGTSSATQS